MFTDSAADAFDLPSDPQTYRILETILRATFRPEHPFRPPREVALGLTCVGGIPLVDVLSEVRDSVAAHAVHVRHPAVMAHMLPPPLTVSVVADLLIGALNQCAFVWEEAPFAKGLEDTVIRWMCDRVGYGPASGGFLTGGGTMSNTLAMFLALQRAQGSRSESGPWVIATDQAHLSMEKAAALVGLPKESVLRVPTDASGRLVPGHLREAVVRHGGDPFLCVCTAGTTSAGVLEPAQEFLAIAREHGAWCHIDAAYGGFVSLTEARRQHVGPWREADSISWDAHKSLHASYSAGALLLRDSTCRKVLRSRGVYALKGDGAADAGEDHFDGSRRMEALKLWMCIRHLGTTGYVALAERMLMLAKRFAQQIRARAELELVTEPDTGIVCFRYHNPAFDLDDLNELNRSVQQRLFLRGGPLLSCTRIGKRDVLRAVLLNPRVTPSDLVGVVDRVVAEGRRSEARIRSRAHSPLFVVSP